MSNVGSAGEAKDLIVSYAEGAAEFSEEVNDLDGASLKQKRQLNEALSDGILSYDEEASLKKSGFTDSFVHTLAGGPNGDGAAALQARVKARAANVSRASWTSFAERSRDALTLQNEVATLKSHNKAIPTSAQRSLQQMSEDLLAVVKSDAPWEEKLEAAEKLSQLDSPEAVKAFEQAAAHPDLMNGLYAPHIIAYTQNLPDTPEGREAAIKILTSALKNKDLGYRSMAMSYLGPRVLENRRNPELNLSVRRAIKAIKDYANDPKVRPDYRAAAYGILSNCGIRSVVKPMIQLGQEHPEHWGEIKGFLKNYQPISEGSQDHTDLLVKAFTIHEPGHFQERFEAISQLAQGNEKIVIPLLEKIVARSMKAADAKAQEQNIQYDGELPIEFMDAYGIMALDLLGQLREEEVGAKAS